MVPLAMLLLGLLLGFVGIGGAGFIAAILIIVFHVPVHLALGTSLGAMFVTALVGGWSHLREGNVDPVLGLQIGLAGMAAAYVGSSLALMTGAVQLKTYSGSILIFNSLVLYFRTRLVGTRMKAPRRSSFRERWREELPGSTGIGLVCGFVTGYFSIGAAPWLQVGLLLFKGTDLRATIGTAMFALGLTSFTGAVRFAQGGMVDPALLASVIAGLSVGSFIGAKFTRRAPRRLVRGALIATPFVAGSLLVMAPVAG